MILAPSTLCGVNQSILVLLLHLHIKGHQLYGIMIKTRRDAVPYFPDLVDDRIIQVLFHRSLQGVPAESPMLAQIALARYPTTAESILDAPQYRGQCVSRSRSWELSFQYTREVWSSRQHSALIPSGTRREEQHERAGGAKERRCVFSFSVIPDLIGDPVSFPPRPIVGEGWGEGEKEETFIIIDGCRKVDYGDGS